MNKDKKPSDIEKDAFVEANQEGSAKNEAIGCERQWYGDINLEHKAFADIDDV